MDEPADTDRPRDAVPRDIALRRTESADLHAFLLKLVHDLRSPLNASLMWLDVLRLKEPTTEARKALDAIHRSLEREMEMLRELGEAVAYDNGQVEMSRQRVRLDELIERVTALPAGQSSEPRIDVEAPLRAGALDLDLDLDRAVRAIELIAGHFAAARPAGRTQIAIRPGQPTRLLVTIARADGAVAAESLRALLQPPWRRPPKAYESKGLELGLFIAERSIAGQGGSVRVVDSPSGAAIELELRLAD